MLAVRTILLALALGFLALPAAAQTIEEVTRSLPPHVSVLTTWGMRPEWDETSENVYFLHRLVGDVFKVNVRTREITPVTVNVHHGGTSRRSCGTSTRWTSSA